MVHIFMLILVLLDNTMLTNSRYLYCELNIRIEISLCVDEADTRDKLGSNCRSNTGSSQRSPMIVIIKQY